MFQCFLKHLLFSCEGVVLVDIVIMSVKASSSFCVKHESSFVGD